MTASLATADDCDDTQPSSIGKVLLLTGCPPGRGHVGEIILRDLVLHVGLRHFVSVAIVSRGYPLQVDTRVSELDSTLIEMDELFIRRRSKGFFGSVESMLRFLLRFLPRRDTLFKQLKKEASGISSVFAVLNNGMIFGLAHRLADALKVPLVCLVWDPPAYLLQQARYDRLTRQVLLRDFRKSLQRASRVAVVSRAMECEYAKLTTATFTILRHVAISSPSAETFLPLAPEESAEWVIGFAGSMYAEDAWLALLRALDDADWVIAGRAIRLRLLTPIITVVSWRPANIDFLGYRDATDVQSVLRTCDMAFLPQPFSPYLRELCEMAFPTKLSEYLSAGLPVLVLAPEYSALHEFLAEHPVGTACASLDSVDIRNVLRAYIGNRDAHERTRMVANSVAREHFGRAQFTRNVEVLLGCRVDEFRPNRAQKEEPRL